MQNSRLSSSFYQVSLIALAFLLSVALILWFGLSKVETHLRKQTASQLRSVLEVTQQNLHDNWYQPIVLQTQAWANETDLHAIVQGLVDEAADGELSSEQELLELFLKQARVKQENFQAISLSLLSPSLQVLASTNKAENKQRSWLAEKEMAKLRLAFDGRTQFIPPIWGNTAKLSLFGQVHNSAPEMYILCPVISVSGSVLAVLSIGFDPSEQFSAIAQASFFGQTGESYFFNQEGVLLTQTRYVDELREEGRLGKNQSSILNIRLPQVSDQPIPAMSPHTLLMGTNVNASGYLDYRGVLVLGAWTWDPLLNIGLVAEIDENEVLTVYRDVKNVIVAVFCLFLLLLLVGIYLQQHFHRKARLSVEYSEHYLRKVLDNILDAVITCSRSGEILSFSHTAQEMFSYKECEALGRNICDLFPKKRPEEPCFIKDNKPRTFIKNQATQGLNSLGHLFPAKLSVRDIIIDKQSLYLVVVQDCSKIEQTEKRLNDSHQQLAQMADLASFAIVMFDYTGCITFWNRMAQTMFGWSYSEALGANVYSIIAGYEYEQDFKQRLEALANEHAGRRSSSDHWEFSALSKQGRHFPVELAITLVNHGEDRNAIAIINDVSQRKHDEELNEKKTQEIQCTLAQLENSRKAALSIMQDANIQKLRAEQALDDLAVSQEKLHHSKELAEAANRSKSAFLATMSHELRTPMNAIIGMSELILKTKLDKQQHTYIDRVHRSAGSLLRILNDILDFSKIEAGKLELEVTDFDLEEVFSYIANLLSLKSQKKGIEFIFDISPQVPRALMGDPLRLGQILVNLCSNAVKFTDSGYVCLMCKLVSRGEHSALLEFSIQDTGIGISPEQMSLLFKAFTQADNSTSRQYGGTGLGLVITQNLVELFDGELQVDSCLGEGSIFSFSCEFECSDKMELQLVNSRDVLKGQGILLLLKSDKLLASIAAHFEFWGLAFQVCETVEQLMEQFEGGDAKYSHLIVDDCMSIHLSEHLKNIKQDNSELKICLLQPALDVHELSAIQGQGIFDDFIAKPILPSQLLQTLSIEVSNAAISPLICQQEYPHFPGAKVLIVEDNEFNQELITQWLKDCAIDWRMATNGLQALNMLKEDEFQLVLMDIQMPVMDGLSATKKIRAQDCYANLPIIAMTAGAMLEDKAAAMEVGMNDFISKPIELKKLHDLLSKWLTNKASSERTDLGEDLELVLVSEVSEQELCSSEAQSYFDGILGMDLAVALTTAQNDFSQLTKLISMFNKGQSSFVEKFTDCLEQKELGKAHILAHTLKGIAAYLGLSVISKEAQQLDQLCKQAMKGEECTAQLRDSIKHLSSHIKPTLYSMQQWLKQQSTEASDESDVIFDKVKWQEELSLLQQQLRVCDADAIDRVSRLLLMTKEPEKLDMLEKIKTASEVFDFDSAEQYLNNHIKSGN